MMTVQQEGLDPMSGPIGMSVEGLSYSYGNSEVLKDISLTVQAGSITGLVGRNGVGKTTLLSLMAAHRPLQSGTITVGSVPVWENPSLTSKICLIGESVGVITSQTIKENFKFLTSIRPRFDRAYAEGLLERFQIPMKKSPENLSTGQRSTLGAVVGLASRCEMTMLDEVHLGMDAVARRMFYQELMEDYVKHPRTFIISSHLLDEIEDLLEYAIVLVDGEVAEAGLSDDIRQRHSAPGKVASLTDVLVKLTTGERDVA